MGLKPTSASGYGDSDSQVFPGEPRRGRVSAIATASASAMSDGGRRVSLLQILPQGLAERAQIPQVAWDTAAVAAAAAALLNSCSRMIVMMIMTLMILMIMKGVGPCELVGMRSHGFSVNGQSGRLYAEEEVEEEEEEDR